MMTFCCVCVLKSNGTVSIAYTIHATGQTLKENQMHTVLDLTPPGGFARLVSAVAISPPFCHVFVTHRKAIGSVLV